MIRNLVYFLNETHEILEIEKTQKFEYMVTFSIRIWPFRSLRQTFRVERLKRQYRWLWRSSKELLMSMQKFAG